MYKIILLIFIFAAAVNVKAAAIGDILKDDAVAKADDAVLAADAGVFDTLGQGIAVSVARCAAEHCTPDVSKDELKLLIKKLNNRISVLPSRYQKSSDKQLENILLSYASSRDSYNGYLDKLNAAAPAADKQEEESNKIEFKDEF